MPPEHEVLFPSPPSPLDYENFLIGQRELGLQVRVKRGESLPCTKTQLVVFTQGLNVLRFHGIARYF